MTSEGERFFMKDDINIKRNGGDLKKKRFAKVFYGSPKDLYEHKPYKPQE